jgi:hypothetical protein
VKNPILTAPHNPPRLSELVHSGGFFCVACEHFSEPTEETVGQPFARCQLCNQSGTLKWIAPVLPRAN